MRGVWDKGHPQLPCKGDAAAGPAFSAASRSAVSNPLVWMRLRTSSEGLYYTLVPVPA